LNHPTIDVELNVIDVTHEFGGEFGVEVVVTLDNDGGAFHAVDDALELGHGVRLAVDGGDPMLFVAVGAANAIGGVGTGFKAARSDTSITRAGTAEFEHNRRPQQYG
jgi:hypothetical protein